MQKFKGIFRPKTSDLQKKRSSSQKRREIRFKSTKNTNLGLDLRSKSPEPINFFGVQSSLGGVQFSFGGHKQSVGGHCPGMPPRGAGSASTLMYFCVSTPASPASWSSGNAFVSGEVNPRFKSRAGQIGHSVAHFSPSLQHFFEKSSVARAQ